MSNTDLLAILSLMPDHYLERAISDCILGLVANSEYEYANRVLCELLTRVKGRELLKASATAIGVQIAMRLHDFDLGIARFKEITHYGNTAKFLDFRSDALFHLASAMLPDNPTRLKKIWEGCLSVNLSCHSQHILVKIGIMLARQFFKNRNIESARVIYLTIKRTFKPTAYGKELRDLEMAICLTDD